MPTAYVFINTETGCEFDVTRELRRIEGIEEASPVFGAYDIVVRVTAESTDDLRRIISWQIRKLHNVKTTLTTIIEERTSNLRDKTMLSPTAIT
ncbi:MAG: Lrp/AsnC ligand binding domain-containing protein [Candidatus Bathyarchaeota archaeon]|nr:Lrp/AsnC ligand binding domain-containing protein [Candidatus Bathyarchaeota archaeon]